MSVTEILNLAWAVGPPVLTFVFGAGGTLILGWARWYKPLRRIYQESREAFAKLEEAHAVNSPGGEKVTREEAAAIAPELFDVAEAARPLYDWLHAKFGKGGK